MFCLQRALTMSVLCMYFTPYRQQLMNNIFLRPTHQIGSVGKRERESIKPGMVGQAPGSTCAPVHGERPFC